jgi:hypothetical protein
MSKKIQIQLIINNFRVQSIDKGKITGKFSVFTWERQALKAGESLILIFRFRFYKKDGPWGL